MDFTTTRDDLTAALSRVTGIAEKRSTTPIMSSVLIQARHMGGLRLTATDKALTYIGEHPATVHTPGEIAVSAHELAAVVASLRPGEIRVTLSDNLRVVLKSGKTTTRLNGHDPATFPVAPPLDTDRTMTIAAADFRKVIDQVRACIAPEDNRYGLNGAHIENVGDGVVRFVATEGNRLAWSQTPFAGELGIGKKMILPRKGLVEMRRLLDGHDGSADLAFGPRAAVFKVGSATLHIRLLEADFPDYRQVLPTAYKRRVNVDRREFSDAIKRVGIFATDGARSIRFAFGADGIVLSARKLDAGDAREEVPADLTGEPITMGFNSHFLHEALSVLAGSQIQLQLGDALSPCVVTDPGDERCQLVVMPVRID